MLNSTDGWRGWFCKAMVSFCLKVISNYDFTIITYHFFNPCLKQHGYREILTQKSSESVLRMEHWPRLSSQRMKRRSHLFPGHDGPVTSLTQQSMYDSSKFISCGQDGSVFVWNASEGKELFRMDGFSESISSLACLGRDLLVTDGMAEYVCVHDFGIEEDAASNGYDLEW